MIYLLGKLKEWISGFVDWIYRPFSRIIPPETFRYGFTGGINTVLDIGLYFLVYHYILHKQVVNLGFIAISPHIASFLFVFPFTFLVGFLLARHITFTSSALRGRSQLKRYGLTVMGSLLINYILLKVLVEQMHIWPTVSKIITTVFVIAWSYLMQRYFTFKTGSFPSRLRDKTRD